MRLTTLDMTSQQEKRKQQRTRRNVLISLPQSPEAFSGPGGVIPRHALSKAQTLGEKQMVMQCLATGSVVLLVGKLIFLETQASLAHPPPCVKRQCIKVALVG